MSNRNYEIRDLPVAAGGSQSLRIPGEFVRVQSISVNGAKLHFTSSEGDDFYLGQYQGFRWRMPPEQVLVSNEGAADVVVTLLFGDGEFDEQGLNILSFPSYVNSGGLLTELQNGQLFGGSGGTPPVAAQYGHLQLLNPAGSGVSGYVLLPKLSIPANSPASFRLYSTPLTSLAGNVTNLNVGGTAGKCEIRYETNAALLGSTVAFTFVPAYGETSYMEKIGIVKLDPGEGMVMACEVVNTAIRGNYLLVEV